MPTYHQPAHSCVEAMCATSRPSSVSWKRPWAQPTGGGSLLILSTVTPCWATAPKWSAKSVSFHLGLDVIVPLGTPLHAPLDAVVQACEYEEGEGNYGGWVLLKHASHRFEPFYSLYGHLCRDRLPKVGRAFPAGAAFAQIGDFHENGNWFHHTHIQVITQKGLDRGYLSKGYCATADLARMNDWCPSPIPLFIRS